MGTLNFILTVNGGEERVDEVLVKVFVLTHLVDTGPLGISHLLTNTLRCLILPCQVTPTKLEERDRFTVQLLMGSLNMILNSQQIKCSTCMYVNVHGTKTTEAITNALRLTGHYICIHTVTQIVYNKCTLLCLLIPYDLTCTGAWFCFVYRHFS